MSVNLMHRFVCVLLLAAVSASAAQMVDQIRSRTSAAVWWVGNAGWVIRSGDVVIGIDLDLSTAQKVQPPPITARDAASLVDVALCRIIMAITATFRPFARLWKVARR